LPLGKGRGGGGGGGGGGANEKPPALLRGIDRFIYIILINIY
jgi:hypothetical protein